MKIKSISILIIAVVFVCIGCIKNAQAQNEVEMKPIPEKIHKVTRMLQLKLLLNNEQLSKIDATLIESIPKTITKESREETLKLINVKIETVLTKKQKTKFDIIKSKWLDEVIVVSE